MTNALSVRPRRRSETPAADEVYIDDGSPNDLDSAEQLVILIHGYNNSVADARISFDAFRKHVGAAIPPHELWEFHWPGDHEKWFTSLVTYGERAIIAPQVGRALASFLRNQKAASIVIVAHSLGCRVALETVRAIGSGATKLREIFLLAAAVPVPLCEEADGRFPQSVAESREHVFYSGRDLALGWAFERGQEQINEYERGPAVGRTGDPRQPPRWTNPLDTNLEHADYWKSRPVSEEIMQRLGRPTVRHSPGRHLSERSADRRSWKRRQLDIARRKLRRR